MKKVIAITLNYNQNEYSVDCINSLLKTNYENFEVFLIDNGSTQENYNTLQEMLPEDKRLHLIRLENNIGYVGGVNHGLKLANENKAEYFLIMNNDTLIDQDAVQELVTSALRYDNNAIVSGKVYNYDEKDTLQYIGNAKSTKGPLDFPAYVKTRREKDMGQYDFEREMGMLDDIFWLIPKNVFDKVGYYSDYFFLYGEQNDYALRAISKGVRLIYTHTAKLWHKGKITTANGNKNSPKITYWSTMATLKLITLHINPNKVEKFRYKWILKYSIKRFYAFFRGRIGLTNLKAHFLAIKHFKYWNTIRYKDNGYNPF